MAKKVLCPNCRLYHDLPDEPKAGTFENRVRRPFRTDVMAPTFPQPGIVNQAPAGLPSMDTHVRIPLRQAMITGLLEGLEWFAIGGGTTGVLLIVVDAIPVNVAFTPIGLGVISGGVGAICGLIAFSRTTKKEWPVRLEIYDALLWIEEIAGMDIDGDGEIGEPAPEVLKVELHDANGIPRLIAEFDTDRERFAELARLILVLKKGFSEETASEAGYSRKEWVGIRDRFFSLQAAAWKNRNHPKQGIDLGSRGINILRAMLPPTLSTGDVTPKNTVGTNAEQRTDDLSSRYDHIQGAK